MRNRSNDKDDFLRRSGWPDARVIPLAGDASFRRYERVFSGGRHAVLMDAPPDKENIQPFIQIAEHLTASGFSAPGIYARDREQGFLLLEDLGDDLFARVLATGVEKEQELYQAAADVLVDLYHSRAQVHPAMPEYDMPRFLQQAALLCEWFLPLFLPETEGQAAAEEYRALWKNLLKSLPDLGRVLVLYDYHAENLVWLPGRVGVKRAGLLDFQDAVWGSPAYDMVSLLEDARRDVGEEVVARTLSYYLSRTGINARDFMTAYALLGAQRNCRIIGTFIRLARRDGKRQYLAYLPRVWRHLAHDLAHPVLAPLKAWVDRVVPLDFRGVVEVPLGPARASA